MTDDNQDNTVRIGSQTRPDDAAEAAIRQLNDGHDEVVLSAVGGARENLGDTVGRLLIESVRSDTVYSLPELDIVDVDSFVQEFENDEAEGIEVTVAR